MTILADWQLELLCQPDKKAPMIEPFKSELIRFNHEELKQVSHGVSSYGYDVTAADEFKIFTNINQVVIDPKMFDEAAFTPGRIFISKLGKYTTVPPNSFCLARSIEYMRMPRDVIGLMTVKSTYARCGTVSPPTVLEPGWEGHITIEISNTTPLPVRIYANEGIAQVLFFKANEPCKTSYADRQGKYQGQRGITLPR